MIGRVRLVWTAAVVALTLTLAVIPFLLLDPSANDGSAPMTALFGFPMAMIAVLLAFVRTPDGKVAYVPLLVAAGILVLGMIVLAIPAVLADPVYYAAQTPGGMTATMIGFAVFLALGLGAGILAYFVVTLPVMAVVTHLRRLARGETPTPGAFGLSVIVLAVEIVIVGAVILFGDGDVEDLVLVQIATALFGIPTWWEVSSELGLWVVRVLLVGILAVAGILTVLWYRRPEAAAQSQAR